MPRTNQAPKTKLFVEGRYRKLSRDLPQTVFFCPDCKGHPRRRRGCERCEGFGKLTRDSVQELVGWVVGRGFGTRKHKFHGAGREDVDVRMLGRGRPFVMELIDPKVTDPDLAALEALVNDRNAGRLEVQGLHWSEKGRVRILKETQQAKAYQARVAMLGEPSADKIASLLSERFTLAQNTPQRVAHRRADLVRERWVELREVRPSVEADLENDPTSERRELAAGETEWMVSVATQHGTYVKEFISGEDGRTEPSLAQMLEVESCTCLDLDVLNILAEDGGELEVTERPSPPPSFGAGI